MTLVSEPSPSLSSPVGYSRGVHIVAVATACALLPLILVGAGVTTTGAGLAYPDWPTSGGHLVNPPGWYSAEPTLWEHGHRLLGWTVGILAITLAAACWGKGGGRRTVGAATLLAIIVQGSLGGLRVTQTSTALAMVHGMWGQVCFCLACAAALITSRAWLEGGGGVTARAVNFFRRGCVLGVVSIFIQLGLGATYRHFGVRHAFIAHLLWAVWLLVLLGWATFWMLGEYPQHPIFGRLGRALAGLLIAQVLLGGGTFLVTVLDGAWSPVAVWAFPSAHVLVGAMLLACMVLATMSSFHVLRAETREHGATLGETCAATTS